MTLTSTALRGLGGEVHDEKPAAVFEHHVVGADGGEVDVEVLEERHLSLLAGVDVEGPDVGAQVAVAIGEEVERRPVPHGLAVVGVVTGDISRLEVGEIEEPDVGRRAAAVALPGPEVTRQRHVGEGLAVGRQGAELAVRHRQHLGQPAVARNPVELAEALFLAAHRGREQDRFAVGVPAEHPVVIGVVGHANRHAAADRKDEDVLVAVVVAAEPDQGPVGREPGKALLARRRAQPYGDPALLGDNPDVAAIDERDLGGGHIRLPEQPGIDLSLRGPGRKQQYSYGQHDTNISVHEMPPPTK